MASLEEIRKEVELRLSRKAEPEYRSGCIQSWRVGGPDRVFEPRSIVIRRGEACNDAS